jgi:hypothetical protein
MRPALAERACERACEDTTLRREAPYREFSLLKVNLMRRLSAADLSSLQQAGIRGSNDATGTTGEEPLPGVAQSGAEQV